MLGVKLFRNRHRYQTMLKSGDWFRDLLVLTLLLGSFFGFKLGERALWSPDEGRYSEVAREMVVTGDYITPRLDGIKFFEKPPLFYWLECIDKSLRFERMVAASLARHVRLARLSCGLCGRKEAIRAENRPARLRRAGYFRAVLRDEPSRRS